MNTETSLPEMTHENHFKFGYNGEFFNTRVRLYDRFDSTYGRSSRPVGTFQQECIACAKLIYAKAQAQGKQVNIFYSGGLDSEVVVEAFVQAGVPFKITTMRFARELNKHDIMYVEQFAKMRGLEINYVDLDPELWYASDEAFQLAVDANCKYVEMTAVMWLLDQCNSDYVVMGNGDCYLFKCTNKKDSKWVFKELEYIMAWYFHVMRRGQDSAVGFFQYTPEVMLAFLDEPVIQSLCNNEIVHKMTSRSSKYAVYKKNFEVGPPRSKYTGFEFVARSVIVEQNKRLAQRVYYDKQSITEIEYNKLKEMLRYV